MYPAFEDLEEPCSLHLGPDSILITYQMKSIITQYAWNEIKHLKGLQLRDDDPDQQSQHAKNLKRRSRRGSVEIDRHNILKLRMLTGQFKLFRFDTRRILDEFLMAAIRTGRLEKMVYKRLLMTRVKYVPSVNYKTEQLSSVDEGEIRGNDGAEDSVDEPDQRQDQDQDDNHNWTTGHNQTLPDGTIEERQI